ncbi:Deoxyribonuclease [Streptococcus sp. ZB199]|nr:Deoxyribonuclease [Streptococcus sp. ZB199]
MKKRLLLTILTALLFGACSNQNEVSQNETEKPVGFVQKEEKAKKERDEQEKIEKRKRQRKNKNEKKKKSVKRKRLKQNNLRIKQKLLYKR